MTTLGDACTVLLICNNDSTGKGNMTCHQSLGIGTKRGDLGRDAQTRVTRVVHVTFNKNVQEPRNSSELLVERHHCL